MNSNVNTPKSLSKNNRLNIHNESINKNNNNNNKNNKNFVSPKNFNLNRHSRSVNESPNEKELAMITNNYYIN